MNQRELLAQETVDRWEAIEGESMREGHRSTMEYEIARTLEMVVEKACKAVCAYCESGAPMVPKLLDREVNRFHDLGEYRVMCLSEPIRRAFAAEEQTPKETLK